MVLMMALPAASWSYAVRTVVTAALLLGYCRRGVLAASKKVGDSFLGLGLGLLVLVLWIAPDGWSWYRKFCVIGDPYTNATVVTGWLFWVQLFGSAFVISVAEELFFRKWLLRFAGFWWMVALFAVEHNRWLVGAIAGALYGLLYLKRGLFAAIVAHATTNLLLGLYVIRFNHWEFW